MLTLTTRPDPGQYAHRVTVAGHAGAPFTLTAEPVGREAYEVRFIGSPTADPSEVLDYEAPFGVQVRYTAATSATSGSVLADPLEVSGVVLSSTMRVGSARPITLIADHPHDWETRSAWFDVIGRRDPLVTVDAMRYRSGVWEVRADGPRERSALLALLLTGEPLLLRASCPEDVDDAIVLPLRASEVPALDNRGPRHVRIEYQAVTRTLGPFAGSAAWTFADLADLADTFADLPTLFDTFAALSAGPLEAAAVDPGPAAPFGVLL